MINTFSGGMDKDTAHTKYSNIKYEEAVNLRLITDEGLTTGAMINIEGNEKLITLPNTVNTDGSVNLNYKIIGSTNLRDDIILFTTNDYTDAGGDGQIWRVTYDRATLDSTTSLIYQGALNFSTKHLIEAVGRYETADIQRIYWTDNFNPVRSLNVKDPGRQGILPDLLALNAEVTIIPPKVTQIGDVGTGTLDKGTYSVTYILQTKSGSSTVTAPFSVPVSINACSEALNHWDYQRSDHSNPEKPADKSITFTVEELPDGYDYIEIFLLKRGKSEGTLYRVDTSIVSSNSFEYTITGNEGDFEPIFRDEIESFNATFDTAKTITIKDNRLIVGNTTERSQIIDYDAKSYRGKGDGSTSYKDGVDDINPYNRDITDPDSGYYNRNQFKPSSLGATLGGEGANIDFEFTTRTLDVNDRPTNSFDNYPNVNISKNLNSVSFPVIDANGNTYDTHSFNAGGLWNSYKNPYIEHLLAGYQRDEVYRFGILFYDKFSRPMDVKWIADIRMPEIIRGETVIQNTDASTSISVRGLKFTVKNLDSVKDKVSGFSIVRAPRPNKDKTILGQGICSDVVKLTFNIYSSSSETFKTYSGESREDVGAWGTTWIDPTKDSSGNFNNPDTHKLVSADRLNNFDSLTLDNTQNYSRVITFDSPQLLNGFGEPSQYGNIIGDETDGLYPGFSSGLKLRPVKAVVAYGGRKEYGFWPKSKEDAPYLGFHGDTTNFVPNMHYSESKRNVLKFTIRKSSAAYWYDAPGDVRDIKTSMIDIDGAIRVNSYKDNFLYTNYTKTNLLGLSGTNERLDYHGIDVGRRVNSNTNTLLLGLKNSFAELYNDLIPSIYSGGTSTRYLSELNTSSANNIKIIANIFRDNPGQYGGATKLDRANTTYISTGHYQKVDSGTPDQVTFEVFGGDTYINWVDIIKNYPCPRVNVRDPQNNTFGPPDAKLADSSKRHFAGYSTILESTVNMDMIFEKGWGDYQSTAEREAREDDESYVVHNSVSDKQYEDFLNPFPLGEYFYDYTYRNRLTKDLGNFQAEDYSDTFIPLPADAIFSSVFDNRIYASEIKINGETADNWTNFKVNNTMDVDGHHGPINKLEVLNEKLLFFQDSGTGMVAVNPRSLITDADGSQIELGTGDVLHDHDYISTEIGTRHQRSVVKSKTGIYFFDANSRKYYRFRGQGLEPLSDIKQMSGFFYNNLNGTVLNEDNIIAGSGIASGFDPRYNEVMITYKNSSPEDIAANTIEEIFDESVGRELVWAIDPQLHNTDFLYLNITDYPIIETELRLGADLYVRDASSALDPSGSGAISSVDLEFGDLIKIPQYSIRYVNGIFEGQQKTNQRCILISKKYLTGVRDIIDVQLVTGVNNWLGDRQEAKTSRIGITQNKTLVFSEAIDAFTGFYSFTPEVYISDDSRFFTPNPASSKDLYIHNKGPRCTFYDATTPDDSSIKFIINPKGMGNKIFNNVEYLSQLVDTDGNDIIDETFNTVRVTNEYQDSELQTMLPYNRNISLNNNQLFVRRRMRNWRLNIPRSGVENARIRNPYTTIEFVYNNNNNKKLTLNDVITYYQEANM